MRRSVLPLALVCVASSPLAAQPIDSLGQFTRSFVSVDAPVVALTGVRVVDGTGAAPAENRTVIIANGRISAVGRAGSVSIPAGARTMNLAGHTVIPGLVGLHDHTFYMTGARSIQSNTSAPRLYLATGVTTIRTTGTNSPYSEINLKAAIERGDAPGPRMHLTGPYLTGEGSGGNMSRIITPEDARRVVGYWGDEGATWIKFYTTVTRDAARAAIDEAHKRGMKVTGHLCSLTFREAVALGIDNLEHGLITNTDYDPQKRPDECPPDATTRLLDVDLASDAVRATFREMIAAKVPMTSTLAIWELYVPGRPPIEQRMVEAMSADAYKEYLAGRQQLGQPGTFYIPAELFRKAQLYEYEFVKAGGLLAAGSDPTGLGGALPGFGDQRNYDLLIEAGFSPAQAIQVMTSNGAKVLGVSDSLGTIAPGKLADLVVIRGNPVATPAELRNVTIVFKDGVGYDPAKLLASVKGLVGVR